MKETADATGRFAALDGLREEFLRVARAESLPRRRLRLRRVALALAVALAVVPAGFALAEDDASDAGVASELNQAQPIFPEGFLDPPRVAEMIERIKPLLKEPEVASRLEAMGYEPVGQMDESYFAQLDVAAFAADLRVAIDAAFEEWRKHPNDFNVIGDGVTQTRIQECRANPNYGPHSFCGIELAKADGKLPPGEYTDAELQAAVRAAGYEWVPND